MDRKEQDATTASSPPAILRHGCNFAKRQRGCRVPAFGTKAGQISSERRWGVKNEEAARSQLTSTLAKDAFALTGRKVHEKMQAENGIKLNSQFGQFFSTTTANMLLRMFPAGNADHFLAGVEAVGGQVEKPSRATGEIQNRSVSHSGKPALQHTSLLGINIAAIRVSESLLVVTCGQSVVILNRLVSP